MLNNQPSLLIVDDDVGFVRAAAALARARHFDITVAGTVEQGAQRLRESRFDLAMIDLALPDGSGLELLPHCDSQTTDIVLITGSPTVESALLALRTPLRDYLVKPIAPNIYQALLDRTAAARAFGNTDGADGWHGLVGESEAMRNIVRQIQRVAASHLNVLVQGESGVGKELVAEAIHAVSGRPGAFVALNCGAVSPELLASQLFGHERGSFTGAQSRHLGYFEQAHGGTLFLDEITELPLHLQAHLLRALESRHIRRVGGNQDIDIDVRVVAATNRPLAGLAGSTCLREDLFYRLAEFAIQVPPLRERPQDLGPLVQLFLSRLNARHGSHKRLSSQALQQLEAHAWPGNVRELRNAIGQAFVLTESDTIHDLLPNRLPAQPLAECAGSLTIPIGMPLDEIERRVLLKTLTHCRHDKTQAARVLGISVKTVYNRLARYTQEGLVEEADVVASRRPH